TIVPRTMGALGYVMNVPEEEKYLNTEKEIRAMLVEYVAGRAAEEIVFDTVTTGAANDIEQATRVARAMVTQYGMSKKFGLIGLEVTASQYLDNRPVMNCSDATAAEVDKEVMQILKDSYDEAKRLLTEHRRTMDKIAEFLIEKETITGKEFMEIFRECEGEKKDEEKTTARIAERPVEENPQPEVISDEAGQGKPVGEAPASSAEETDSEAAKAEDSDIPKSDTDNL
ncbi:MAG: AAA family ATPase, partial [Lachnospiraceae bacterium]|nr:AAA family ATPase [Lachnospiraceae bacterium]